MSRPLVVLLAFVAVAAAGGSFVAGRMTAATPVPGLPAEDPHAAALERARATAEAGTMRDHALDVLASAHGLSETREALDLLGRVGAPSDAEILGEWIDDETLGRDAVAALGRLGGDDAVDRLLGLIRDYQLGGVAIDALGNTHDPRAIAALTGLLDDPLLAGPAATALGNAGTPDAAEALIRAFDHGTSRDAQSIASALALVGADAPEAHAALMTAARSAVGPARDAARHALAWSHDPEVYSLLIADLESGSNYNRSAAVQGLAALGDVRAIPALAKVARTGPTEVRSAAVGALGQIPGDEGQDALLDLLVDGPTSTRTAAIYSLRDLTEPSVLAVLLETSQDATPDLQAAISSRIFSAYWQAGKVPPEVFALANAQLTVVRGGYWPSDAFAFLLHYGSKSDLARLEDLLMTGPSAIRSSAVWTLQQDATPRATELLLALAADPDPAVRSNAISAVFGRGPDAEARLERQLLADLSEGSINDYGTTETALVRLNSPEGIDAVFARIDRGTQRERSSAVNAIASGGSPELVDRLLTLAEKTDDDALAGELMQSLLYADGVDLARLAARAEKLPDPSWRTQILIRLGTPEAADSLIDLATHGDVSQRSMAMNALSTIGTPDAERAVISALDDPDLRWTAVSTLQSFGTESSKDAVRRWYDSASAEDQAMVLGTIASTGDPAATELVNRALHKDDPALRGSAIGALESLGSTEAAEQLASVLDDPDVGAQAAGALHRLGGAVAEAHADDIEALLEEQGYDITRGVPYPEFPFGE